MGKVQHDSATPAHGKQVISAVAFIHADFDGVTKVFLPKRAETKVFLPGLYEMPGGHIDFAEDIVDGLKREIKEELGMSVSIGDPFAAFTYVNNVKGSHSIEVVFFGQFTDPIEQIKIDQDDHSGYEWFALEDIIARKNEIIPPADSTSVAARDNDQEYEALQKGFAILSGTSLNSK